MQNICQWGRHETYLFSFTHHVYGCDTAVTIRTQQFILPQDLLSPPEVSNSFFVLQNVNMNLEKLIDVNHLLRLEVGWKVVATSGTWGGKRPWATVCVGRWMKDMGYKGCGARVDHDLVVHLWEKNQSCITDKVGRLRAQLYLGLIAHLSEVARVTSINVGILQCKCQCTRKTQVIIIIIIIMWSNGTLKCWQPQRYRRWKCCKL
jgi:hypothetical protein